MKEILVGQIHGHSSPKILLLCYYMSLLLTARELWCMNQERLELRWGSTAYQ
jgi:hypothetical protein